MSKTQIATGGIADDAVTAAKTSGVTPISTAVVYRVTTSFSDAAIPITSNIEKADDGTAGAVEAVGEEGDGNVQIFNTGVVGHSAVGNVGEEDIVGIINESNNTAWGESGFGADSWGGQPEIVGVGEIGTVSIDIFNGPTSISGVSATGNTGNESGEVEASETGVSATGNVGEETLVINSTFNATGISSTGNTGTVSTIVNPAWGQGDWGDDEWGE